MIGGGYTQTPKPVQKSGKVVVDPEVMDTTSSPSKVPQSVVRIDNTTRKRLAMDAVDTSSTKEQTAKGETLALTLGKGEAGGGESWAWLSEVVVVEARDEPRADEVVDSPPHREKRSKLSHDPASARGKATAQTGQSSKRPRTSSPAPTEKASKQPKATPSKPPKALPKIKVAIPIASGY